MVEAVDDSGAAAFQNMGEKNETVSASAGCGSDTPSAAGVDADDRAGDRPPWLGGV